MPFRSLGLAVLLLAPLAFALPPSAQKRLRNRAEVDGMLEQLVDGGSVQTIISKLKYNGETEYAADEILIYLRKTVDERGRRNLVAVLAGLETRGAEGALVKLAQDPDSAVRMYSAQGLGRIRSRNVEVLLPLLEDKSSGVRKEAAKALGASRNSAMSRMLLAAAKKEPELEVRAEMLVAAGRAGDTKQIPALKEFLASDSESTRFAAARGLCQLGSPDGFTFANKLLGAEDRFVRRQGLVLYEGVPAKKAEPALRPLLEDKDRTLAAGAARVLYQGGDKQMMEWLVLASWNAKGYDEKAAYEKELETLQLADDVRKTILRKAGVAK
ncbi:HEAT repeat domain-containing protein [Hyalangium rubrum]|uniref:HEAT repeat domain-containing protein n=1 Tax=Hyalangium rubrum TaxID=3103134 RepID=A0ABU5HEJ9_9BACT|nr:HEAT repeat domain-containing protein [Hyalangium sp. s54d21]MDY7230515.1 HEAT repeat domain-containing protein [Hyalangium sp. s54d21]